MPEKKKVNLVLILRLLINYTDIFCMNYTRTELQWKLMQITAIFVT